MAESKEELKSLLMSMKKESEKADLKLNIQKIKIMASGSINSWQIDGETMEKVTDFIWRGCKIKGLLLLQGEGEKWGFVPRGERIRSGWDLVIDWAWEAGREKSEG